MKNIVPGNNAETVTNREVVRRRRWPRLAHCSICTSSIWFSPIALKEPVGAPEPRREWQLCKSCHQALLVEMRRSPLRSPLRLRIALGFVASERSPKAYGSSTHIRDRRSFISIIWVLIIAMLLHLAVIVVLATMSH